MVHARSMPKTIHFQQIVISCNSAHGLSIFPGDTKLMKLPSFSWISWVLISFLVRNIILIIWHCSKELYFMVLFHGFWSFGHSCIRIYDLSWLNSWKLESIYNPSRTKNPLWHTGHTVGVVIFFIRSKIIFLALDSTFLVIILAFSIRDLQSSIHRFLHEFDRKP